VSVRVRLYLFVRIGILCATPRIPHRCAPATTWRAQACRHTALSLAAKSKIESSTIESSRGDGAKAVQKRRLQIWITRGPKFEEHRAEVRAPWRFPLLSASL